MKFHKLISRTVLATALLGTTIGGAFAGINANAQSSDTSYNTTDAGNVNGSAGNSNITDNSRMAKSGNPSSRTSEFGAHIKDGGLTLDSVPNLGFGNNSSDTSSGQDSTLQLNNNSTGVLQVTDNRNIDKRGTDQPGDTSGSGWNLTTQIVSFYKDGTPVNNQDNWTMRFNNLSIDNQSSNPGNTTPKAVGNDSANYLTYSNSNGNTANIIDASNGNTGYGTNTINFNNPNNATLSIPNVQNGSYTATMTWNLNTNLGSYNTGYGS